MPVQELADGQRPDRASIASLCFASLGLAISSYLTVEHYSGSTALACPENAAINCAKVTTSSWSRLGGIPVAVLGLFVTILWHTAVRSTAPGHSRFKSESSRK